MMNGDHEDFPLSLHNEMQMFRMGALVFLQPKVPAGTEQTASLTVELNNGVVGLADFSGGSFGKKETIYGVIGMAKLLGGSILAVITGREKVCFDPIPLHADVLPDPGNPVAWVH